MTRKLFAVFQILALCTSAALLLPQNAYALTCGTGSSISFTDIGGGQCRGYITATGAGTFTVPTNWTSNNTIETIGGGGGGANAGEGQPGGGGGGGAYSKVTNVTLSGSASYSIGAAGAANGAGGDTYFNAASCAGASACAKGGGGPSSGTGGPGGAAASGVGSTKYSGGDGMTKAASGNDNGGGGGGAAGKNGAGGNGTGSAGGTGDNGTGGAGGSNHTAGSAGTEWDATHGTGGGGGPGDNNNGGGGSVNGGTGGNYGGGGGGGGYGADGAGNGAGGKQGIIVITYGMNTLLKPPNNLGLVGYWSFDDGAGTKATDFSGNGNSGSFAGAPVWANGKRGKALTFNGSSDYLNAPFNSVFNITGNITLSAWIKRDGTGVYDAIVAKTDGSTTWDYDFYVCGTGSSCTPTNGLILQSDAIGGNAVSTGTITDTNWHHVAVTRSGSVITFYIDGVSAGTDSDATAFNANSVPVRIGTDGPGWSAVSYFDGKLDEVRVYNRALGPTEVASLYGQGTGASGAVQIGASTQTLQNGTSLANGLVGLWSFDGYDLTDKVYDRSGQGNNGYFIGGATSSAKAQGKLGQALNFDGSNDYVSIPLTGSLTGLSTLSICAWVNVAGIPGTEAVIVGDSAFSESYEYSFEIEGDRTVGLFWRDTVGSVDAHFLTTTSIQDSAWTHVCVTRASASAGAIYFNGVSQSSLDIDSDPAPGGQTGAVVAIGRAGQENSSYFNGRIDDVRIYNRVLAPAEVKQLYKLGAATIGR